MNHCAILQDIDVALGLKRAQLQAHISKRLLTPPVKIGLRASRWLRSKAIAISRARVVGNGKDEIREFVKQLVADRTALFA